MKNLIYVSLVIAAILSGCGLRKQDSAMNEKVSRMQDSVSAYSFSPASEPEETTKNKDAGDAVSSSAAVQSKKDSARKFVRTAEMKFRVQNVYQASLKIEKITAENDGFVTFTNLNSDINRKVITPVSADSSLETIYYDVQNDITIRVPNYNLDTTIREVAKLIKYLDYRIIRADDVSLLIAANNFVEKRVNRAAQRIEKAAGEKPGNLNETVNAEENILNKQRMADQLKTERMKLLDQVSYSTLKINIYQREVFKREIIENDKNIDAYEPSFWVKVKEAFIFTFDIFLAIILFFIRILAVLVFGLIIYWLIRKIFFKKKPKV